jgi:hypothetical protein
VLNVEVFFALDHVRDKLERWRQDNNVLLLDGLSNSP